MFEEVTGCFLNSLAVGEIALAENVRNDWQIFCIKSCWATGFSTVEVGVSENAFTDVL
jgi:hypothetical protein